MVKFPNLFVSSMSPLSRRKFQTAAPPVSGDAGVQKTPGIYEYYQVIFGGIYIYIYEYMVRDDFWVFLMFFCLELWNLTVEFISSGDRSLSIR